MLHFFVCVVDMVNLIHMANRFFHDGGCSACDARSPDTLANTSIVEYNEVSLLMEPRNSMLKRKRIDALVVLDECGNYLPSATKTIDGASSSQPRDQETQTLSSGFTGTNDMAYASLHHSAIHVNVGARLVHYPLRCRLA
jgi:hypothetical protein